MTIKEEREKLGQQIEAAYNRLAEIASIEEKNDEEQLINRLLELGFQLNTDMFNANGSIRYFLNIDDLTYEVNISGGFYVYKDGDIIYEPYFDDYNRLQSLLFHINNCPEIYLVKRPDYMVSGYQCDELENCEIVKTYKLV